MESLQDIQGAKVRAFIDAYGPINEPHPTVVALCESPDMEQRMWELLGHHLRVIDQRSSDPQDYEVTAAEKAFAVLTREQGLSPATIALWVEEILGLKFVGESDGPQTLDSHIYVTNFITRQAYGVPVDSCPLPDYHEASEGSGNDRAAGFPEQGNHQASSKNILSMPDEAESPGVKPAVRDAKLKRLFSIYHTAKNDLHAALSNRLECTDAAKFLRDTIENFLSYLENRKDEITGGKLGLGDSDANNGKRMLEDLHATLREASIIAEAGLGGRKRRFDVEPEVVHEKPNPPKSRRTFKLSRSPTAMSSKQTADGKDSSYHDPRRASHKLRTRRRHPKALATHRSNHPNYGSGPTYDQSDKDFGGYHARSDSYRPSYH